MNEVEWQEFEAVKPEWNGDYYITVNLDGGVVNRAYWDGETFGDQDGPVTHWAVDMWPDLPDYYQ